MGTDIVIPVEMKAVNGIKSLTCEHFHSDTSFILLDTTYTNSETNRALDFMSEMPFLYRPTSKFVFTMTDENDVVVSKEIVAGSRDAVDTTGGTVTYSVRDSFKFDFEYTYALATYYQKQNSVDMTLYDADGDYIEITFIEAIEGEITRFAVNLFQASNEKVWEKHRSRKGATDEMSMSKSDVNAQLFSGKLTLDVNLDRADYDVVTVEFTDIALTNILPSR